MNLEYVKSNCGIHSILFERHRYAGSIFVYLHGAGEFGSGFERQYQYPGFATLLRDDEISISQPFVVACCQEGSHWHGDTVDLYLSELRTTFVDADIDIIGYSRGGNGVYSYIQTYSGVRSATVINANAPTLDSQLITIPLHIVHAENDHVNPIEPVKKYVESASSGKLFFTAVPGDHYSIESVARSGIWCRWEQRAT